MDTQGNVLCVIVHAANIHDTKSEILAAMEACKIYKTIRAFCADAGYRGTFVKEVKNRLFRSQPGCRYIRKNQATSVGKDALAMDRRENFCMDEFVQKAI